MNDVKIENQKSISFVIDNAKITLIDIEYGKGSIIIEDSEKGTYSMIWGAMGCRIDDFILKINKEYFANKLIDINSIYVFDVKKTFSNLRKFIREEFNLPYYVHQKFQKDLRGSIKIFENNCLSYNSQEYFVENFNFYLNIMLNYHLIENKFDRDNIESNFSNIDEPWGFIETKKSDKFKWLEMLHLKIQKKLKNEKYRIER